MTHRHTVVSSSSHTRYPAHRKHRFGRSVTMSAHCSSVLLSCQVVFQLQRKILACLSQPQPLQHVQGHQGTPPVGTPTLGISRPPLLSHTSATAILTKMKPPQAYFHLLPTDTLTPTRTLVIEAQACINLHNSQRPKLLPAFHRVLVRLCFRHAATPTTPPTSTTRPTMPLVVRRSSVS